MFFVDKSYSLKPAEQEMAIGGAVSGAILNQNIIGKNKDLDRWRFSVRAFAIFSESFF